MQNIMKQQSRVWLVSQNEITEVSKYSIHIAPQERTIIMSKKKNYFYTQVAQNIFQQFVLSITSIVQLRL